MYGKRFPGCASTPEKTIGWVEPRGVEHGQMVEVVDGQPLMKLRIDTKVLPASAVKREAQKQAKELAKSTGRSLGKTKMRELREEVRLVMLSSAFSRECSVLFWLDRERGLVVIDATARSRTEEALAAFIEAFPIASLSPVQVAMAPAVAMANWLLAEDPGDWPQRISVEHEGELVSRAEDRSAVKFSRHNLMTDEVRLHITQGKLPTRLALSWDGRVAFTLTDAMKMKKITFTAGADCDSSAQKADAFDAHVAIATGELRTLIPDLIAVLGGEK